MRKGAGHPASFFYGGRLMTLADKDRNRGRIKAMVGVVLFHALLGYALVTGLGYEVVRTVGERLRVFDVAEVPPPPVEEPKPAPRESDQPEGEAAPPSLRARPSPVVAPPPRIQLEVPPPVVTVPEPKPGPVGNDPSAGSSDIDGIGTGSGGEGAGTGSGGQGTGGGGGGIGQSAERVGGTLDGNRDYPRSARIAGIEGSVAVRFTVGTDGRVSGCRVIRSSASPDLDSTTCRLVERRFRYRPARNAEGRPVAETISRTFDWSLPRRN